MNTAKIAPPINSNPLRTEIGSTLYHPSEPALALTVTAINGKWVTVRWFSDGLPQNSSWLLHQLRTV